MSNPFNEKRRQQFVTEQYYFATDNNYSKLCTLIKEEMLEDVNQEDLMSQHHQSLVMVVYEKFSLRYTAGIPIEELRSELTGVIEALERYQKALAEYEGIPKLAPLSFRDPGDYERAMQLIGLCYLLHRRDLLPRIADLLDPAYFGEDTLYEDLLSYAFQDRAETDNLYHLEIYDPLIETMYAETDLESIEALKKYLLDWYPSFKYVPWHDGHLRINGDEGDYFGYWAFEAGAVAYLCDIDDSDINHMVYPKDLVAWARENKALSETGDEGNAKLRCAANQPCPQSGIWHTPANKDSRRAFKAGDLMPDFPSSDYGLTIWYLDESQEHWDLPS
ncbi:MAG: PoNe immunity protein domain-containing protein [Candidatus Paceibacterota bacterium]|jgi:hypothetical protein